MRNIDADIAARGVHPVQVETQGTTHRLHFEGDFDTIKFTAETNFNPSDTLECNGAELSVLTAEGEAYTVPAWKAGDAVVLILQQESARVLAPMTNKANSGKPQDMPLELPQGITGNSRTYCYVDDFGVAHVKLNHTMEDGFSHSTLVAKIPEGCRGTQRAIGMVYGGTTSSRIPCMLTCAEDGSVHVLQCGATINKQPKFSGGDQLLPYEIKVKRDDRKILSHNRLKKEKAMPKTPNLEYGLTTPIEPVKNYNRNLKRIDADIAARGVHPIQVEAKATPSICNLKAISTP